MENRRHPTLKELKMELAKTVRFQQGLFPPISTTDRTNHHRSQNASTSTLPSSDIRYTERVSQFHDEALGSLQSSPKPIEKLPVHRVLPKRYASVGNLAQRRDKQSVDIEKKVQISAILTSLRERTLKYQIHGDDIFTPDKSDVKKCVRALELLTDAESPFRGLMWMIVKILKMSVFLNMNVLHQFPHVTSSFITAELKDLLNVSPQEQSQVPYYMLVTYLLKEMDLREQNYQTVKNKLEHEIADFRKKAAAVEEDLKDALEKQRVALIEKSRKEYEMKIKRLNREVFDLRQENDQITAKFDEQVEENKKLLRNIQNEISESSKMTERIKVLQADMHSRELQLILTASKLDSLKEHAGNFKELLDKILIQLSTTSRIVKKLRDDKFILEDTIEALKSRSAIQFEDLTPRPDFKKLIDYNHIDLNIKPLLEDGPKRVEMQRITTGQRFAALVDKYLEVVEVLRKIQAAKVAEEHEEKHENSPRHRDSKFRTSRGSVKGNLKVNLNEGTDQSPQGTPSRRNSKAGGGLSRANSGRNLLNQPVRKASEENTPGGRARTNFITQQQQVSETPTQQGERSDSNKGIKSPKFEIEDRSPSAGNEDQLPKGKLETLPEDEEETKQLSPEKPQKEVPIEAKIKTPPKIELDVLGRPLKTDSVSEDVLKSTQDLINQISDTKMIIDQIIHE